MIAFGAFLAGALSTAVLWRGLRGPFARTEALQRANYRGHRLPIAAGLAVVLGTVVVQALYALVERVGGVDAAEATRGATVLGGATIGFALIGLFDDLAGDTAVKGFAGHLGALRHGEVTSGMVKLAGGVLFGVLAVPGDLVDTLRGGLLVAAAANLANLFDRAPGRVVKVSPRPCCACHTRSHQRSCAARCGAYCGTAGSGTCGPFWVCDGLGSGRPVLNGR